MENFVEFIREDGTIEYRHPNYDEMIVASQSQTSVGPTFTISDEEILANNLDCLRFERDKLLAETDWWANSDRTMTAEQTAYRQALRDITDTYTSLDDVVWPTKPE